MIYSLALIILGGLASGYVFQKLKLPELIGMILLGIVIGPFGLNLLSSNIYDISADLRSLALIIILIKAGLNLDLADLKKVGPNALMMSFLPASFEIVGYFLIAPLILPISHLDALIIGSVLAAVSPAVVVPKMLKVLEEGYGKAKAIPQMVLAGASLDDIYVIVLFTTFVGLKTGSGVNYLSFAKVPLTIILGILIGLLVGFILKRFFHRLQDTTTKTLIILACAFFLVGLEKIASGYLPFSGLIATMVLAMVIAHKENERYQSVNRQVGSMWKGFSLFLFVLIGAAVNINYASYYGLSAILIITLALVFRSLGVSIALIKSKLNLKERLFVILAYIPKATVQAAIGGVCLAMGLDNGSLVLSFAVVSILFTAPLGAFLVDLTYQRLLSK